jgi:hypothetical protein
MTAGRSLLAPFDRRGSLADLRALGQVLDAQAKDGATAAELDETLIVMKRVHGRITAELRGADQPVATLASARHRRKTRATKTRRQFTVAA